MPYTDRRPFANPNPRYKRDTRYEVIAFLTIVGFSVIGIVATIIGFFQMIALLFGFYS